MSVQDAAASSGTDPGTGATRVFLSYCREDRPVAEKIVAALGARGLDVWWDARLQTGLAYARQTEEAIESAAAIVVLWSPRSIGSHWVRDEAGYGRDHQRLVPVAIEGAEPPLGFRQFQVLDLSRWRGKASAPEMAALYEAVIAVRDGGGGAAPSPPPAGTGPSRRLLLGAGSVAALALAGGLVWRLGGRGGGNDSVSAPAAGRTSIAVLPFQNLSGDPAQDYLSAGLSEEVRATLSASRSLDVAAQTSSANVDGQQLDAREIARRLGVAAILDGSVRQSGTALRVVAELIDGKSGFKRWAQSFDRTTADILAVQREIATLVADALAAQLAPTLGEGSAGGPTPQAYDAYLRGKALYQLAADETTDRAALAQFDRAISLDPKFANAHAARARTLTVIANSYLNGAETRAQYAQAVAAARTAIDLAPDLAVAQSALGFVLFNGMLDVKSAETPNMKAYELGYGNADILSGFASFAARTNRIALAREAIGRAERLDPLNPAVFRNAGVVEICARDYSAALVPLRAALTLSPRTSGVHSLIGDVMLATGAPDDALAAYASEPNRLLRLRGLAIAARLRGRAAEAQDHFDQLVRAYGDNGLYQRAQVLAQWGETAAAVETVERAFAVGDSGLVQALNDRLLDPLRREPKFVRVLASMGFAQP